MSPVRAVLKPSFVAPQTFRPQDPFSTIVLGTGNADTALFNRSTTFSTSGIIVAAIVAGIVIALAMIPNFSTSAWEPEPSHPPLPNSRPKPKRKQQQPQDIQAARLAKAKNELVVLPIVPDDPQAHDLATHQVDLSDLNVADLKSLCKDLRQHRGGKKDELLVRLVEFSEGGMDLWKNTILSFATRAHNGPSKAAKKRKPSAREAWLNEAKPELVSHNQHVGPSQDRRTQAEKDNLMVAMREIMGIVRQERQQNIPLRNSHLPTTAAEGLPPSVHAIGTQLHSNLPLLSPPIPSPLDPLACQRYVQSITSTRLDYHSTNHTISPATANISQLVPTSSLGSALVSDTHNAGLQILSAGSTTTCVGADTPSMSIPKATQMEVDAFCSSTVHPPPEPTADVAIEHVTIQIQGAPFVFTKDEVSPPEPLRFSDTKRLLASWDDDGWNPAYVSGSVFPVRIRGHPIPLVYLPVLFRNNPKVPHVWEKEKNKWTQCRDFIREYRRLGESRFWETYSDNKGRMSFTALIKEMRSRRANYDQQLVAQAKVEYGEKFHEEFAYPDGHGGKVVMTAVSKIARAYCKKTGVEYIGGSNDVDEEV